MNGLLVDTNVLVWLLLGERAMVSETARGSLEDERNSISVSAVSVWEIAIKRSLGKLEIEERWPKALRALGFEAAPVTALHAERVEWLPWHHRDPFDRLLIAQADVDDHRIVSADRRFADYDVEVVW